MSSQLKVSSIRDTSNNEALSISSGNVSFNNTISAGTIGDNVVHQSAKYYLQLQSTSEGSISNEMMNNSGSTVPYFSSAGVGDTTNIVAVNNHDYKLVKAGIYLIHFSAKFYESSNNYERFVFSQIRTNLSSPTSSEGTDDLASINDQVANTASDTDYGSASCHVVHNFSANSLINFRVGGSGSTYFSGAVASICLIRPT
ncbi:hypothetical protein [uncultured Mediterranean phage uvMED]|nr:hypothetical protein [uncultured Mediterranean phage uvMED]